MQKLYMLLAISAALQSAHGAPVTGVCNTSHCLHSAASILKDIRASADPCIDFSEFACGGFYERERLHGNEKKNGHLTFIEQRNTELIRSIVTVNDPKAPVVPTGDLTTKRSLKKLQSFYGACMDEAQLLKVGRQPLQDEIRKMTELYPVDDSNNVPPGDRKALSTLLGYNMRNGFENFIAFDLWDDETNPGYKIMTAQQSGLGLKDESLYSDEKIIKVYERVIGEMFYIIQGEGNPTLNHTLSIPIPAIWEQIGKDVVAFEKVLAGVVDQTDHNETNPLETNLKEGNPNEFDPDEFDPDEVDPNEVDPDEADPGEAGPGETEDWDTIADLDRMTPSLDWTLIFKTAFPKDVPIPTKVNMLWKFYLRRSETALQQTTPRTIQNYFAWTLMRNLGGNLAEPFQGPLKELEKALPGNSMAVVADRWKTCVEKVNENLGEMAGHFFVKATFPETSQAIMNDMIGSIRWSFEKSFWQYDWLDPRTRQSALQKLKAITQKVGYSTSSPNVVSSASIDEHYRALEISGKDHFGNQVRSSTWRTENMLRSVSQPANRIKLVSIPQTVNAFYNPNMNSIEILAGILQPPFFHFADPEYLNFAGIGVVAAHELSHAFDNSGRRYDESGALRDWWTESSIQAFDAKSQCFIEQYNEFTIKGPDGKNHYVNGWGTLGENIADNGGLKVAFEAWRQRYRSDRTSKKYNNDKLPGLETYTPEQLFFIQYARAHCGNMTPEEELRRFNDDNHSPRKWRIDGVVQNSDHFAQAFQCKSGTPMNPIKKCVLL